MDAPGLQILLLLGLATVTLAVPRDFHLINELKTWSEAQAYCRDKYYDLATIDTEEEQAKVTDMVVHSGLPDAWIGLYDNPGTWRWSLDDALIDDREPGTWFKFNQNKYQSTHSCAFLWYGVLRQGNCASKFASTCYDETTNTYHETPSWMTWANAQAYCRATYTDLANVRTQQELDDIKNAVDQVYKHQWVGLHRLTWKWSEFDDPVYTAWWPSEPDGNYEYCASAGAEGWNSTDCAELRPFICSGPPHRVIRVTLKTSSSVNINDPRVREAVLKKVEEDLGAQIGQGLRLSWRSSHDGRVFNQTEL